MIFRAPGLLIYYSYWFHIMLLHLPSYLTSSQPKRKQDFAAFSGITSKTEKELLKLSFHNKNEPISDVINKMINKYRVNAEPHRWNFHILWCISFEFNFIFANVLLKYDKNKVAFIHLARELECNQGRRKERHFAIIIAQRLSN